MGTGSLQSRAYSERKRRLSFFVAARRSTTGNQDIQEVKAGQGSTLSGSAIGEIREERDRESKGSQRRTARAMGGKKEREWERQSVWW